MGIKILFVDEICTADERMLRAIRRNSKFVLEGVTKRQAEAIKVLTEREIDVVILGLELKEGDGLHLLKEMKEILQELPEIIVVTGVKSHTVLDFVRAQGADFIFKRGNESFSPEKVLELIEMTFPFHKKRQVKTVEEKEKHDNEKQKRRLLKKQIEKDLLELGFPYRKKGTTYIAEAICIMISMEETEEIQMSNDIYPLIAKHYRVSTACIEKCIRDAKKDAWEKGKTELRELFLVTEIKKETRPTNIELLWILSDTLKFRTETG